MTKVLLSFPEEQLFRRGRRWGPWLVWWAWTAEGLLKMGLHGVLGGKDTWSLCQVECILGKSSEKDLISLFPSFFRKLMLLFFSERFLSFFFFFSLLILIVKAKPGAHGSVVLMVQAPCLLTSHSRRLFKGKTIFS